MKKLNQSGFETLTAIITVLVIAAVAATGWYVWQKNKDDSADTKETSQVTADQELAITELGISLPLDEVSYTDLEYSMGTAQGEAKSYQEAYIRSESLMDAVSQEHKDLGLGQFQEETPVNRHSAVVTLLLIPTEDFIDGRADYPTGDGGGFSEGGGLSEEQCPTTLNDKKVCVFRAFMDYGNAYQAFVDSITAAAAKATSLE